MLDFAESGTDGAPQSPSKVVRFLLHILVRANVEMLFLIQASVSKSAALTEAHREEEFNSEVSNVDSYIKEVETTIKETETGTTLTTVKAQYTKHKVDY